MTLSNKYTKYIEGEIDQEQLDEVLNMLESLSHNVLDKYVDQFTVCDNNQLSVHNKK